MNNVDKSVCWYDMHNIRNSSQNSSYCINFEVYRVAFHLEREASLTYDLHRLFGLNWSQNISYTDVDVSRLNKNLSEKYLEEMTIFFIDWK